MKYSIRFLGTLVLAAALGLAACDDEGGSGDNGGALSAGDKQTVTANGVSFVMVYVPGGITFPTSTSTDVTATIDNAYWIGKTEVTYELWQEVYDWATTDAGSGMRADGGELYYFANTGLKGNDGDASKSEQHPVTMVNWRDSMVWCNALTEWCNAQTGTAYDCVYYSDSGYSTLIRDSRDGSYGFSVNPDPGGFDDPYVKSGAKGFRLLTINEWELAARYCGANSDNGLYECPAGSGCWWTPDYWPSGAAGEYNDWGASDSVAWFGGSTTIGDGNTVSTQAARGKQPNLLCLYDMSGNVREWCFDLRPNNCRSPRGGCWSGSAYNLCVRALPGYLPYAEYDNTGFRFGRTR
ncbi:MAG TPA: SUMF1/EgtB/PvdO family nonheme iron enzyme [Spirochaetota bacterium]|nr:SUMF1/EgtB/PvdO family nonheme iron enzyme [Spirochaetota bacterium]HPI89317.1 SUMF1/EgtB/PvdO family nonheme iron enzyme [Spirochaetota bacterium]HPR49234.1 SUMF1/EgtB/PvdO family nonheme iron enzyme [Spirochaetota bacterium]